MNEETVNDDYVKEEIPGESIEKVKPVKPESKAKAKPKTKITKEPKEEI